MAAADIGLPKLTDDVLTVVFDLVLTTTHRKSSTQELEPLRLVCSQWNTAAQHPRLWRYASLSACTSLAFAKRVLVRSCSVPLALTLDYRSKNGLPRPTLVTCEALCAVVAKHLWHIQYFDIWLFDLEQSLALTPLLLPAPMLRGFALKCMPSLNTRTTRATQPVFSSAARLQRLEMLYILPHLELSAGDFPSLLEATLTSPVLEWRDLVQFFLACPVLETLTLRDITFRDGLPDPLPPLHVPRLRRLLFHRLPCLERDMAAVLNAFPMEDIVDVELITRSQMCGSGGTTTLLPLFVRLPLLVKADIVRTTGRFGISGYTTSMDVVHRLCDFSLDFYTLQSHNSPVLNVTTLRCSFKTFLELVCDREARVVLPKLRSLVLLWTHEFLHFSMGPFAEPAYHRDDDDDDDDDVIAAYVASPRPGITAPQLVDLTLCSCDGPGVLAVSCCTIGHFRMITTTSPLRITLHNIALINHHPDSFGTGCRISSCTFNSESSCDCDCQNFPG